MSIVEQRKAILPDSHGKSDEEVKDFLIKAGFNLKREYTTLRGQAATIYIQDIDPPAVSGKSYSAEPAPKLRDKLIQRMAEKAAQGSAGATYLGAAVELLTAKIKNEEDPVLTPIEMLLAKMLLEGMKEVRKVMASNDDGESDGDRP